MDQGETPYELRFDGRAPGRRRRRGTLPAHVPWWHASGERRHVIAKIGPLGVEDAPHLGSDPTPSPTDDAAIEMIREALMRAAAMTPDFGPEDFEIELPPLARDVGA
ncbi:MAG: hypothetical protein HRU70_09860 [Phycisphaeraceae bacterium]|nr:MAG: hypothetical protein HRU70_09860 [Phycisphaeraceae bacterium]